MSLKKKNAVLRAPLRPLGRPPHPHTAGLVVGRGRRAAVRGQSGQSARDAVGHRRHFACRPVVGAQHDAAGRVVFGQPFEEGGIGAPEAEHALVGVARDGARARPGADDADQLCGLRIEVLCVVDEQMTDPRAFGCEQFGVGRERRQGSADQFGRVERGRGSLGCLQPHGPPQEHDVLVSLRETAGRDPFWAVALFAECDEVFGTESAFVGAQHQVAQFDGEAGHAQRGTESLGPHARTVVDVAAEQLAEDGILFGAGDQSRGRVAVGCRLEAQDRERVRVDCADEWFAGGACSGTEQPGGDRFTQRGGGAPGVGEHEHRFGVDAGGDAVDHQIDQQ